MKHLILLLFLFIAPRLVAQDFVEPLDFDLLIAGNYGELRPNHFHAGLDFKTQQTIGHPVHAFADGYVERAAINAYGYGLVLYVTHPQLKRMTVYAHLSTFGDKVWQKVRERQQQEQLNNADITFSQDELPVKMGEVIALSGNTGSSGGPHVHFEVRGLMSAPGADDEEWYDPMPYFADKIKDTTAPKISNIYLYNNPNTAYTSKTQILNRTINAWGRVGFGLKAYDYMDGTTNKYGVKHLRLFCDNKLIYDWNQEFFVYSEQRYTNSVIDYEEYIDRKSTIMKTYIEPGNKLRMINSTIGDGTVLVDEERQYNMCYELEDAHGNVTTLNFKVLGVKQETKEHVAKGKIAKVDESFVIDTLGVKFEIPANNLYCETDVEFSLVEPSGKNLTPVYSIGKATTPLHSFCTLQIELPDSIELSDKLYIRNLDGGRYACERIEKVPFPSPKMNVPAAIKTQVREFGRFTVRQDTIAPEVTIVGKPTANNVRIQMTDANSGLKSWKVFIDGVFVPFDQNNRGIMVGAPKNYGIKEGMMHTIEIHALDLVENEAIITLQRRF